MNPDMQNLLLVIGAIASPVVSIIGFVFIFQQIIQTNKNLKIQTHSSIYRLVFDLSEIFIDHPELRPYFYDSVPIKPGDHDYNKVMNASELLLDFFEYVVVEEPYMDDRIVSGWKVYMAKMFRKSQSLKMFLNENKDQYNKTFLSFIYSDK
ncbi:MAG: hypothetical protein EOM90_10685 [Alphaproteobacteria bacterium]|nr:hypothetical protein [Alphaproteobacteria bacterium]